jgi:hypothetical protein
VAFEESPWNIHRDVAVKVLCSANKIFFIFGRLQVTSFVGNMHGVFGVDFAKFPPMEVRDIAVKVFSSTIKVLFNSGQLQFNTSSLYEMYVECLVWSFRNFS